MAYGRVIEKVKFSVPIVDAIPHLYTLVNELALPTIDIDAALTAILDLLFGNVGICNEDVVDYLLENNVLFSGPVYNSHIASMILNHLTVIIDSVRQALNAVLTDEWKYQDHATGINYTRISHDESIVFYFERYANG
jgi:hypothetical protein